MERHHQQQQGKKRGQNARENDIAYWMGYYKCMLMGLRRSALDQLKYKLSEIREKGVKR